MKRNETVAYPQQANFDIDPVEPVYVIGVVSRLVRLPIWTLRILDREGVVIPKRREGRARLYSLCDVRQLVQIGQLIVEEGVNIQGVRVILQARRKKAATEE